jgi:hypothetical protein
VPLLAHSRLGPTGEREPMRTSAWQLAARGSFASRNGDRSMVFFFTRRDVGSLNVKLRTEHDRTEWIRLKTRAISASEVDHARLPYRIHYALGALSLQLTCVEAVSAFDRNGKRIETAPSSCSALSRPRSLSE